MRRLLASAYDLGMVRMCLATLVAFAFLSSTASAVPRQTYHLAAFEVHRPTAQVVCFFVPIVPGRTVGLARQFAQIRVSIDKRPPAVEKGSLGDKPVSIRVRFAPATASPIVVVRARLTVGKGASERAYRRSERIDLRKTPIKPTPLDVPCTDGMPPGL